MLEISANSKLTNQDFVDIMEQMKSQGKLKRLSFTSCGIHSPLNTSFIDAVSDMPNLEFVTFTCVKISPLDEETLREIWEEKWSNRAKCTFEHECVTLFVTSDI